MSYRPVAKLVCRIMAIYFFVVSTQFIPNFIVNLINYHNSIGGNLVYSILLSASMIFPLLISSLLLWIFAEGISKLIFNEPEAVATEHSFNYNKIAILAFALLGMFLLIDSVSSFLTSLYQYKVVVAQGINQSSTLANYKGKMIGEIVKVIMSIWLVLGSKGIVNAIKAFRDIGIDKIDIPKE